MSAGIATSILLSQSSEVITKFYTVEEGKNRLLNGTAGTYPNQIKSRTMLKIDDRLVEMAGIILRSRSTLESPLSQDAFIKSLQFTLAISHDEAAELFKRLIDCKRIRVESYTRETDPYLKRKIIDTPELDSLIGLTSLTYSPP